MRSAHRFRNIWSAAQITSSDDGLSECYFNVCAAATAAGTNAGNVQMITNCLHSALNRDPTPVSDDVQCLYFLYCCLLLRTAGSELRDVATVSLVRNLSDGICGSMRDAKISDLCRRVVSSIDRNPNILIPPIPMGRSAVDHLRAILSSVKGASRASPAMSLPSATAASKTRPPEVNGQDPSHVDLLLCLSSTDPMTGSRSHLGSRQSSSSSLRVRSIASRPVIQMLRRSSGTGSGNRGQQAVNENVARISRLASMKPHMAGRSGDPRASTSKDDVFASWLRHNAEEKTQQTRLRVLLENQRRLIGSLRARSVHSARPCSGKGQSNEYEIKLFGLHASHKMRMSLLSRPSTSQRASAKSLLQMLTDALPSKEGEIAV